MELYCRFWVLWGGGLVDGWGFFLFVFFPCWHFENFHFMVKMLKEEEEIGRKERKKL